jgi:hypothetical protein
LDKIGIIISSVRTDIPIFFLTVYFRNVIKNGGGVIWFEHVVVGNWLMDVWWR